VARFDEETFVGGRICLLEVFDLQQAIVYQILQNEIF
jgi:hypothetical protein